MQKEKRVQAKSILLPCFFFMRCKGTNNLLVTARKSYCNYELLIFKISYCTFCYLLSLGKRAK